MGTITKRLVLLLGVVLLAGACTRSDSSPTTTTSTTTVEAVTTSSTPTTPTTRPPAVLPTFPDDDEPVPVDSFIQTGTLDNGLTYLIRENSAPGGRAQLRLVVKAGSVHHDDDQHGVAHYLEHMMFNGTERFPANELVKVLQRFGAEFGPDINAYTNYEETVYMLELPTDDPATLETGFDVLFEWATAATIDPVEVDKERGVLLEEWRFRDQGFWGRYFAAVTELLLDGTPYQDKLPLADPDELDATSAEVLRRFYDDWYRPDLMAIVAVGDFDADEVEGMLRDRFEDVEAHPDPRPEPELFTVAFEEPVFLTMADPEAPQTFVELNYPVAQEVMPATVGQVRRELAVDAAFEMLVTRLHEDTLRGLTPFFDPSFAANPFIRTQGSPGVAASALPPDLAETTEVLLTAVEQARRHGFTQDELDRASEQIRAAIDAEFEARGTTQDSQYADLYVEHFLGGTAAAAATDWHELRTRLLDELTVEQVWDTFAALVESTEPLVIVATTEAAASDVPEEEALASIVDAVSAASVSPRADDAVAVSDLMEAPDPAAILTRRNLSDTVIAELRMENGARFAALPTTIHENNVELFAMSPGGWLRLAPEDVAEAILIGELLGVSGVGDLDRVSLERSLLGKVVGLEVFVDEASEGLFGRARASDLETLFQLVHLTMTAPGLEETGLEIVKKRNRPLVTAPESLADIAFELELADARFQGDERYLPLPTLEELDALDLERARAVFADRFGNAGDFYFVLVGDFDPETAEDLARRYLGTIPGTNDTEDFDGDRPDAPDGVERRTIEAGYGERGVTSFLFSTPYAHTPDSRVHADILEAVIQERLTSLIREELAASYSPGVRVQLVEDPEDTTEILIRIDGDPAGIDTVVDAALGDLAALVADGPSTDEFEIAQEQVLRNYELINNPQLALAMLFSAYHPGENLSEVLTRFDRAADATIEEIAELAVELITLDDYIEIRLVPVGFTG